MKFKNSNTVSAIILLISGLICKILGALFRLPLTNLLGIEGIGIFQLIMAMYSFSLILTCGGVTNSLSKLISNARADEDFKKISAYMIRATIISVGMGIVIGLIFVAFGRYVSAFQGFKGNNSYFLFVLLLPLGAGLSVFRGFFQGYENMLPTAISQILEQVFKFALGLLLAFHFGKANTTQGVFGAFLGITVSEIISLSYLIFLWIVKGKKNGKLQNIRQLKIAHKEFDKANFSLTLSASILPLVNALDGVFIINRLTQAGLTNSLATQLFGLQTGVVGTLLNFPLIISIAMTTALLPNISYLISHGNEDKVVIERGLKALVYLILPSTFGLVALSKSLLPLIYTNLSTELIDVAYELMFYGGFSTIFTALMQYLVMLLQATGQFRFIFVTTIIGGALKAIISLTLSAVTNINIFAIVIGSIFLSATICLLSLIKLKQILTFSLSVQEIALPIFATIFMFVIVHLFTTYNFFSTTASLILSITGGILTYGILTLPLLIKFSSLYHKKT